MAQIKTNNSFLADKVALRAGHLPEKELLRVLDCFGGEGRIWKAVRKLTGKKIVTLPIDIREYDNTDFYLPGDNRAYLSTLDLSKFDVIDLDAYSIPFDQLEQVFTSGFKGIVFATFIQSIMGNIPYDMLVKLGFSTEMIKKCPTLFVKSGWRYFTEYLALRGVKTIWHRQHDRKHYLGFNCAEQFDEDCNIRAGDKFANLS